MNDVPLPPYDLIHRVGWFLDHEDSVAAYEARGLEQWELIRSLLPGDWRFEGTRSLDFGCGAGRILRHAVADDGEYWGCDTDDASLEWLRTHLSPPVHVVRTTPFPRSNFRTATSTWVRER